MKKNRIEYIKQWRIANINRVRNRAIIASKKWRLNHPEKYKEAIKIADAKRRKTLEVRSRTILRKAIYLKKMKRGMCYCGKLGQAHHGDYSKPLDVVWLCQEHHALLHRQIK